MRKMIITERSFILVTESSDTIVVDDQLETYLRQEVRPILWFRDGLFNIVPTATLQNILDGIDNAKKTFNIRSDNIQIAWGQSLEVRGDVGRLLAQLDD